MLISFLLFSLIPSSQAAVVDRLQCRMRFIPPNETRAIETQVDLNAVRRPVESAPGTQVALSEAVAGASTTAQTDRYQAAFRVVSLHAVKYSVRGEPVRAAQHVCLSHTFLTGEKGVSSDCRPACDDPFDRKCRWTPVELHGAVPAFDGRLLQSVTQKVGTGTLSISCKHEGTLE